MNIRCPFTLLAAWLVLAPIPFVHAASSGTGIVEGRVINAVTGRLLNNARITVQGSDLRTFTDETGRFRITNVPAGPLTLDVFFTGLDPQQVAVAVSPGQVVARDVSLTSARVYGQDATVQLDPFTVESAKLTDQAAIAINEQRFAPNIKSVVATGDMSEQPDGNIGEFLKMMPGVATAGGGSVPAGIFIRGFPPSTTSVTVDGGSIASVGFGGPDRTVQFSNETPGTGISRIEVTKVPTPATGADTMAGSVNMVTRTAFEASRAQFSYVVNVAGVLENVSLSRQKTGWEEDMYPLMPGFSLRYTNPLTKNFGFAISTSVSKRSRPQEQISPTRNVNSATFGSTPAEPLLDRVRYGTGTAIFDLANISLKADWRVTPNSVLSASVEASHWRGLTESFTLDRNTGNNASPTVATGVRGDFGEDYTIGATGRGNVSAINNFNNNNKGAFKSNLRYGYNEGDWKIDLQASYSKSRFWRSDGTDKAGAFSIVSMNMATPVRVEFHDIDPENGPATIRAFDNNNKELDLYDPSINDYYRITTASRGSPLHGASIVLENKIDIKRRLSFLPFPAAVQIGGLRRTRDYDYQDESTVWTYAGINGDFSPNPYLTSRTFTRGEPEGKTTMIASPVLAYRAWKDNSSLFYQTPSQVATAEQTRRSGSERIEETAEALYFQAEGRFLKDRLNVLTGVRYEKPTGDGLGALNTPDEVWVRKPDGSYAVTATGARIRKPEAGATGSMEQVLLTWQKRAARSARTYDGYYPSVHLTYEIKENFLIRAAYAKTYGRPNFSFIVPRTVINESIDLDGDPSGGRLTIRNTGLLPWTAHNYDLSLEYYTNQGGVFGAGVFRKEVENFFGSVIRPAVEEDLVEAQLDPSLYDITGWTVSTTVNTDPATVNGFELSMNHSLRPLDPWLGRWAQYFNVFANATKLKISGPGAAGLAGFLPLGVNAGIRFSKKPFMLSVNANYRDEETTSVPTNLGLNGRIYRPARTHIDLAVAVNLRRNLDLFFNVRNLFNEPVQTYSTSDVYPDYASPNGSTEYGAVFNAGIRGSF